MTGSDTTPTSSSARRLVGELVDRAGPTPTWADVSERGPIAPASGPPSPRWVAPLLAAACLAALVGGLVVVVGIGSESADDSVPAADPGGTTLPSTDEIPEGLTSIVVSTGGEARALSEVTELGRTEWVVPTVLPVGFELRYSMYMRSDQITEFGDGAPPLAHELRVGVTGDWFGDPASERELTDRSGEIWVVESSNEYWAARRSIGPVDVVVQGATLDDESGMEIASRLIVVDEEQLIRSPLSDGRGVVVAEGTSPEGQATLSVAAAGDWYCTSVRTPASGGGGCGQYVDPAAIVTVVDGGFSHAEGTAEIDVLTAGITTPEVARIEVEYLDGRVVEAVPSDLSGEFDVEFWVVGATVALDDPSQVNRIDSPIVEVRAFDTDGIELAATR